MVPPARLVGAAFAVVLAVAVTVGLEIHVLTPLDTRVLAAFDSSAASLLPPAGDTPSKSALDEDGDSL